ncbi:MAG TPA: MFS transporter [Myxococcota bacterium]|nr:MFS transporter [Myxococcota bacterium]
MPRARTLLLLTALYVAQGLPNGFFTQALPVLLRERGVSLEAISLSSLLVLPWTLKVLWAPVVDRTLTPRAWILMMQAATAALLVGLAALDPATLLAPCLLVVLLVNTAGATQDVATDGLAVVLLDDDARGDGNGVQVAGFRVGMILGGGALLMASAWVGWGPVVLAMAALVALTSAPLLAWPEVGRAALPPAKAPHPWAWLHLPGAGRWSAVLVVWKIGDYLATTMLRPWMVDRGLGADDIGLLLGLGGFGAGLTGAAMAGPLLRRSPRRDALALFGALQAAGVAGYAAVVLADTTGAPLVAAVMFEHLAGGLGTVALFTAMMDASRPESPGTDYTVQASLVVLSSGIGSVASGPLAASFGYGPLFVGAALIALAGPALTLAPGVTDVLTRPARAPEPP